MTASEWERLNDQIDALKGAILVAPCLVAQPGALTYECSAHRPCRVCAWRLGVMRELTDEYGVIW